MTSHDVKNVYEMLKDQYDLTYTTTLAVNEGCTLNVPLLRGVSQGREFWLYVDGDIGDFIFSVSTPGKGHHKHWHPDSIESAVDSITEFMTPYKFYHRNYRSIDELYNDLNDAVLDIRKNNERLILPYHNEIMIVEPCTEGYRVHLNNSDRVTIIKDQDIYYEALDFVHDRRKDISEITVHDNHILRLEDNKIYYTDSYKREHCIDLRRCAASASATISQNRNCVGEVDEYSILFYMPLLPVRIVFPWPIVLRKSHHALTGRRATRLHRLQTWIIETGYSTVYNNNNDDIHT